MYKQRSQESTSRHEETAECRLRRELDAAVHLAEITNDFDVVLQQIDDVLDEPNPSV